MVTRHHLSVPESVLCTSFFLPFFMILTKSRRPSKCCAQVGETACTPIERELKIMAINVENSSFGQLDPEISLVKGVSGTPSGGPPLRPIWRPLVTWRRVLRTMKFSERDLLSHVCFHGTITWFHGHRLDVTHSPIGCLWACNSNLPSSVFRCHVLYLSWM